MYINIDISTDLPIRPDQNVYIYMRGLNGYISSLERITSSTHDDIATAASLIMVNGPTLCLYSMILENASMN